MENQNSFRDEDCDGRGTKEPKRYRVEHRYQSDRWMNTGASFVWVRDALDYASMCSCYPVIYGMTRVVDTLNGLVVQTFSAGEGQIKPKVDPRGPNISMQLRYTCSANGETWGWLSKQFHTHAEALAFAKLHIFPRNICDAVRVYHNDVCQATYFAKNNAHPVQVHHTKKVECHRSDPADTMAHAVEAIKAESNRTRRTECQKPCEHDTNGDGDCHRCAPRSNGVKVSRGPNGTHVFAPLPQYKEMGGRELDAAKVREWFRQWMRSRFHTEFNDDVGLHCAMFEAFRAAMTIRVLRQHQG